MDYISYSQCSFPGCERKHYAKGYCNPHWQQQHRGKELTAVESVPLTARNNLGQKRCSGCATWKDADSFGGNKAMPDGLATLCRECAWSAGLWSKYKITGHQYMEMFEAQGGVCYLCGGLSRDGRALAVDHDHACCPGSKSRGACVRSLLCLDCNTGLGSLKDDVSLLERAVAYLKERHA